MIGKRVHFILVLMSCMATKSACKSEEPESWPSGSLGIRISYDDVDQLLADQVAMGLFSFSVISETPVQAAQSVKSSYSDRIHWCEQLDQPFCTEHGDCTNGTRCVKPWWATANTTAKVCAMPLPNTQTQRWRATRLRVYTNYVCKRSDKCDHVVLAKYLGIIIKRESTWEPGDRHRLNPDIDGATDALEAHREQLAGNPALSNPDRWMTGLGPLGQNPAIWLSEWDSMAPPESLCHEVIAPEVHLRKARRAVGKIKHGLDCNHDGDLDFWGTACDDSGACQPSWYDMSRINSGSLCPGTKDHQQRFVDRATDAGIDPWGPVTQSSLGKNIARDSQDEIAHRLREEMDNIPR